MVASDENTIKLRELFQKTSSQEKLGGILGITPYKPVFDYLLPIQKKRLIEITNERHDEFMEQGYFISARARQ